MEDAVLDMFPEELRALGYRAIDNPERAVARPACRPVRRACIMNFRTSQADLDVLVDSMAAAGQQALQ
jgi:hypothetical protein